MTKENIINGEKIFCQSQYCKFKKDDKCIKFNKTIIGTAPCNGFEKKEN